MKRYLFTILIIVYVCINAFPQATDLVVDCQTPGWLSSKINYGDQQTVRNLKVTGYINATDLHFIGELVSEHNLRDKIDLSEVNVVNNSLTNNCFGISKYSDITLKCLSLPKTVDKLDAILPYDVYSNGTKLALHIDTLYFNCNVDYIDAKMFGNYQFDEMPHNIIIGENVISVPDYAFFEKKGIQSVRLPIGMEYIGNQAFFQTNEALEEVNFNDLKNLKFLGLGAFPEYQPDTIIVPKSLDNPFYLFAMSHKDEQHIFIDNNINTVSGYAIGPGGKWVTSYTTAKLLFHINNMTPPSIENFKGSYSDTNLSTSIVYVPKGSKQAYLESDWGKATIIETASWLTYNLSLTASGNGSVSYNGTSIKNQTSTFTVNEGTSATISFSPDSGYRIKSVKVNDTDVTSSVSSNSYTISSITANTTLEVEFEAIPPTTYTLSIKATGNGSASYNGNTIKNQTSTFTVNEGTSATVSFSPDNGYRIKSVKLNDTDIASSVSDNSYTISSISANTTLEVEFEADPPATYTLSIKATGNGSASYNGQTIKNSTTSFTVNEGTSAMVSFSPDSGYRIKSVKVNNTDVTSSISDNSYTISSISANTTLEVEFEAIPATTYTLTIKATGNGSASYNGTSVRKSTTNFSVNSGSNATVSFSPDSGYRIKSVKVNSSDVTSSVSSNSYTISSISANTTLEVEFESIPPTTYTLSIKATGNGSASYNGTTIKNSTTSFTANEGTSATVSFNPDSGYRIKSVKVNDSDVTSSISGNSYTISSISANTTLEVEFEAIPTTTYTLTIKATGNGSASYNEAIIRSKTSTFTVNEGTSVSITLTPDNGYRIKSVKENDANTTSYVSDGVYTISNISRNTNIEVEFEAIPATTYTLSIKATGKGSALYNGTSVKNSTTNFSVNSGSNATVTFSPDDGCRIKSVKVNDTDVTLGVANNQYTISNITANTMLEVEFEAKPTATYTLSIKATGNGSVSYNGTPVRNSTTSFTVNEGASATVSFSPDSGYKIKIVKVNNTDITSSVSSNSYTISNISANTTLEVEFEAIPPTTYTLSIKATGKGSASYNEISVKNGISNFSVNSGANATISFNPDSGYGIIVVKVNSMDVTSSLSNNQYTISNITANTLVEVAFGEEVSAFTVDGVNYKVVSQADRTVNVNGGDYGQVLTVPANVISDGASWTVAGIEVDALSGNSELAAVIWNPEATFNATVSNPNLLLYLKAEQYAPAAIQNVVVNGTASNIVLKEASSGNNFYCPQAFTAQQISYTHNYQMQTGIGESRGWETIALPFDVQTITHETKGTIVPFAQWKSGDATKPFWLYELAGTGFVEASNIKAYSPYIISMPNNPQYDNEWLLNGKVTFAASGVVVGVTENLNQPTFNNRTFVPCFAYKGNDDDLYALNVNNDFETNNSGVTEGSFFMWKLRSIHPFEAFMTSLSSAPQYAFGVFEGMTTGIQMMVDGNWIKEEVFYDLQGRRLNNPSKKGVYIVNGKKLMIK